ncbi:MAG: FG-GAP-like repeat-containing protein [Saprospiraceae bacterium]|nr:FG-GAP-like repeat-containing protein [Saprospiraceae bacterium]
MKRLTTLLLLSISFFINISAQISFSNKTNLLTPTNHFSGVAIAILDMNGDGLDDIARLSQGTALNIQYQTTPNQAFTATGMTPLPGTSDTWGMCAADVNNDGFGDVLAGGFYNGIKIARSNANGTFSIQNLTTPSTFVQGVNFADINNDGWLDAFVCHDDEVSRIFGNNGDGTFSYQPNWIDLATSPASDNSGNYGSVWSDVNNDGHLDLYIAHCRQGINSASDPRRINQLFLNNGNGTYTQDLSNTSGLRIGAQSWTADFGDIDNDGDFDCFITNHDVNCQLLENDGSGHFTDITVTSGFMGAIQGLPIQGVFRDFDNDGFTDIILAGDQHYIFRNHGDKSFSAVPNPFGNNEVESFAIGDLNGDGFQDVYAGYALVYTDPSTIPDALWMNNGNGNHFFALNLRGQQSNRSGVGAKVHLYSSLGIQTREVRSGESYGISNSLQIHFGMSQVTQIDSVVVHWPSGVRDVLAQPLVDQYITVNEGGCITPAVSLLADGPTTLCAGQSVSIGTVAAFDHYLWNTGDTTSTILATITGIYNVTITNSEGCTAVSNSIPVQFDPIQIPIIQALGDTTFCTGGEVVLSASEASSYLWSTGDTTQSIAVSQSGQYSVATQGLCAMFNSVPTSIQVLAAPLPTVMPDTVLVGESATLIASGDQLSWYATENAQINLAVNDTLVTPALTETTTYWLSNTSVYGVPNDFVGMVNHQGSALSDNSYNGGLIFDCFEPFILLKTKVITSVAGERKIELRTPNGDVILSKIVNIGTGTTVIDLDFDVPMGTDFLLTTDETFNESSIGSSSPQLRRSSQGCDFPYEIPGVVSVKNSTFNTERYYYFYNWEVGFYGYECTSERVPVTVVVNEPSGITPLPAWAAGLRIFPNPTASSLNLDIQGFAGGDLLVTVKNSQGQTLQTRSFNVPMGDAAFTTDLSHFAAGIYWIELSSEGGVAQRRVLLHQK